MIWHVFSVTTASRLGYREQGPPLTMALDASQIFNERTLVLLFRAFTLFVLLAHTFVRHAPRGAVFTLAFFRVACKPGFSFFNVITIDR